MTEYKIKKLLQEADQTAGRPASVYVNLSAVRRRANRRRFVNLAAPIGAAAVVLIAVGTWSLTTRTTEKTQEQEKLISFETRIKRLQASTDATTNLIHEVLENERKQNQLEQLNAQLASIPDPLEEISKQVDKTAFILVYQADRLYSELNQTDSAVQTYNRVIELFPENRWAKVAQQRITEIENKKFNKIDSEGDSKWRPQNLSSC